MDGWDERDAGDGSGDAGEIPRPHSAADTPSGWRGPDAPPAQPGVGAQPKALTPTEHFAAHLHETSGSAYLYCSMAQVFREVGPDSYKNYLIKILDDAGNPSDPIERMLIEQIVLAHHNIGRLYVKAASAQQLEETRVYVGAAALLTGEFRRSIATLKNYREPTKTPVGRGNVADPGSRAERGAVDGELGTNAGGENDGRTIPLPESQESGGRQEEPRQKARAKRRRA